jgi:hypothetical protein
MDAHELTLYGSAAVPVPPQTQLTISLHDFWMPATVNVFVVHVVGIWPEAGQIVLKLVSQNVFACDMDENCCMPPAKMVITTSAVIRITMAETTTANVVFMLSYWAQHLINILQRRNWGYRFVEIPMMVFPDAILQCFLRKKRCFWFMQHLPMTTSNSTKSILLQQDREPIIYCKVQICIWHHRAWTRLISGKLS